MCFTLKFFYLKCYVEILKYTNLNIRIILILIIILINIVSVNVLQLKNSINFSDTIYFKKLYTIDI